MDICYAFWISFAKASVAGSKKHMQFQLHTKLADTYAVFELYQYDNKTLKGIPF